MLKRAGLGDAEENLYRFSGGGCGGDGGGFSYLRAWNLVRAPRAGPGAAGGREGALGRLRV